jgi:DNA-binding Lrp family transcriptional regulator
MDHTLRLTLAQTTLAKKLGLSRQWVGELVHRLDEAGWLVHVSPTLLDGTNGPTMFMIGNQLNRILFMLSKSKRRKRPTKPDANSR